MTTGLNDSLTVSLHDMDDSLTSQLKENLRDITELQCCIIRTIVAAFCAQVDKLYLAKGYDFPILLQGHLTMRQSRTVQLRIVGNDGIEYMKVSIDTDLPVAGTPQLSKISLYQNPHNAKHQLTNGKADWDTSEVYDQVRRITLRIMKKLINNNIFVRNSTSRVGSKVFEGCYTQTDHHLDKERKPDIVNNLGDAIRVAVGKQQDKAGQGEGRKEFHIPVTPKMQPLNQATHPNLFKQSKKVNREAQEVRLSPSLDGLDAFNDSLDVLNDTLRGINARIDQTLLQKQSAHFIHLSEEVITMQENDQATTQKQDIKIDNVHPFPEKKLDLSVCGSAIETINKLIDDNLANNVKPSLPQDVNYTTIFFGNTPLFTYTTKAKAESASAERSWKKPSSWFKKAEKQAAAH